MAARPFPAVPFIINSQASPIPVTDLDSDYAQILTDFNDSAIGYVSYAADIGVANAYVINLAAAPSAYVAGMTVAFSPANTNGAGASTINVNSLGGVSLTDATAGTPAPGIIKAGGLIIAIHDGTQFRIQRLSALAVDMGLMAATTTISCKGYDRVWLAGNMNGNSRTLTLTNLDFGTDVMVWITNLGTHFFLTASNSLSVAYTVFANYGQNATSAGARIQISNVAGNGDGTNAGSNNSLLYRGVTTLQAGAAFLQLGASSN